MNRSVTTAVLIPVKSFDLAKERLADTLEPQERASLARSMAAKVVAAAAPLPTFVVCGSSEVAAWAVGHGANVIWHEPPGLNRAIAFAAATLTDDGYQRLIIAHGDLPLAQSLAWVGDGEGVTIVPDLAGGGTNVMSIPLGTPFEFHYGEGSAPLHQAEAERRGLTVQIVANDELGLDVDTPTDLKELDSRTGPT